MKVSVLKKQLLTLKQFFNKKIFTAQEIINWVSSCVAFFSSIGMYESIIAGFMRTFEEDPRQKNEVAILNSFIGPFENNYMSPGIYSIKTNYLTSQNIHSEMVYINIAFKTAEDIINNIEESERLIPKSLINYFKEKTELSQIFSSLKLMEHNFEEKNAVSLAENSIALLGSILNLEPSISGKDLSNQLRQIKSTPTLLEKFGIRSEIITALDNSRLLRNYLTSHKHIPIEYNVPFAVSLGTAYLVIMVLQITMATGVLIT